MQTNRRSWFTAMLSAVVGFPAMVSMAKPQVQWMTAVPTASGWYWWQHPKYKTPVAILIKISRSSPSFLVGGNWLNTPPTNPAGKWMPIEFPKPE